MADRETLIRAAAWAIWRNTAGRASAEPTNVDAQQAAAALDAVLPLITQALEAEGREAVQWLASTASDSLDHGRLIGAEDAYKAAIRLVRSLGGNDRSSG